MSAPLSAADVLNREFLEIRARVLQVAASLDRLDRAEGSVQSDARIENLRKAIEVLQSSDPNRAEQIQLIFSRTYDGGWQTKFGLPARTNGKAK